MAASQQIADSIAFTGSENAAGLWDKYPPHVNVESSGNSTSGVYDQNPSVMFHSYGYVPQMSHRPCAPPSFQPSSLRNHDNLYSDPSYYHQPIPPNVQYGASLGPLNQAVSQSGNNQSRPVCASPFGYSGTESNLFGSSSGFDLMQKEFEGLGFGGLHSNLLKPVNSQSSLIQLSSRTAFPKLTDFRGLPGNTFRMASLQEEPLYGYRSLTSSYHGGFPNYDRCYGCRNISNNNPGISGQSWFMGKEASGGGRKNDLLCSCAGMVATQTAQNKGPRASKPKSVTRANCSSSDESNHEMPNNFRNKCNQPDFVTEYKDAKFFVIKSYSEDNVHKSIKYGVWASTPSGNKKLDAAYREAKEKDIPIFLLFSVNCSAQFCGVAEMVGPLDFNNNVDYWLQDKWTGQFPVKWHIIKDVPNSQFRHIIIKDNDNKPVTNSRDTQEVELKHGNDMLNILKNHEDCSSILDDFDFYEERQKAMEERKAGQQGKPGSLSVTGGDLLHRANTQCRFPMSL
ncbi:uncharacterized protein LOC21398585 isoform X1 [Morus notabilis]|uniref:uncharacterized protein LOC21398585 isoform X1 n=1 Tax=Morus notabilis TaxID=981085 RepID=UPI000CED228B|nr:uncharacterized protein LOC21398585 isoform X1 [Morus notabilis]